MNKKSSTKTIYTDPETHLNLLLNHLCASAVQISHAEAALRCGYHCCTSHDRLEQIKEFHDKTRKEIEVLCFSETKVAVYPRDGEACHDKRTFYFGKDNEYRIIKSETGYVGGGVEIFRYELFKKSVDIDENVYWKFLGELNGSDKDGALISMFEGWFPPLDGYVRDGEASGLKGF